MAKLDVRTVVTAPDEINVELVRSDYLGISNIFRVFFEVFLSVAASLLGALISSGSDSPVLNCFLIFVASGAVAFLVLTIWSYRRAAPCKPKNRETAHS